MVEEHSATMRNPNFLTERRKGTFSTSPFADASAPAMVVDALGDVIPVRVGLRITPHRQGGESLP